MTDVVHETMIVSIERLTQERDEARAQLAESKRETDRAELACAMLHDRIDRREEQLASAMARIAELQQKNDHQAEMIEMERRDAVEMEKDLSDREYDLKMATARIAVLESAMTAADRARDPYTILESVLAHPDPLATAVGRVVAAANEYVGARDDQDLYSRDRQIPDDVLTRTDRAIEALDEMVHDLRDLAPWWPTS